MQTYSKILAFIRKIKAKQKIGLQVGSWEYQQQYSPKFSTATQGYHASLIPALFIFQIKILSIIAFRWWFLRKRYREWAFSVSCRSSASRPNPPATPKSLQKGTKTQEGYRWCSRDLGLLRKLQAHLHPSIYWIDRQLPWRKVCSNNSDSSYNCIADEGRQQKEDRIEKTSVANSLSSHHHNKMQHHYEQHQKEGCYKHSCKHRRWGKESSRASERLSDA